MLIEKKHKDGVTQKHHISSKKILKKYDLTKLKIDNKKIIIDESTFIIQDQNIDFLSVWICPICQIRYNNIFNAIQCRDKHSSD